MDLQIKINDGIIPDLLGIQYTLKTDEVEVYRYLVD